MGIMIDLRMPFVLLSVIMLQLSFYIMIDGKNDIETNVEPPKEFLHMKELLVAKMFDMPISDIKDFLRDTLLTKTDANKKEVCFCYIFILIAKFALSNKIYYYNRAKNY